MAKIGTPDRMRRALWGLAWFVLCRFTPVPMHRWRCVVLRAFGAQIPSHAYPYPSARIWAPWNLEMGPGSCLAAGVDCYSVQRIRLGAGVTVSQRSFLCSASHDFDASDFPLVAGPIVIGDGAWVAAEAFIGPGVSIGENAVVLARSVVARDVEASTVAAGNPAVKIRMRRKSGLVK